jgi:hypothetical protein
MIPISFISFKRRVAAIAFAGIFLIAGHQSAKAGEPENVKLDDNKPFVFSGGAGYGISNNPCTNSNEKSTIGGVTFSISLGYKISNKFKIEFGPTFWIEGNDLINKNVADSERPNNKRTMVAFTGTYTPFQKFPVSVKLGGGAGILNYTPAKSTVTLAEDKFAETEIFKGFCGTFGLAYEINISQKLKLYPSVNLWYLSLEQPEISYSSYVDYKQAAITTDFRVNLNYNF